MLWMPDLAERRVKKPAGGGLVAHSRITSLSEGGEKEGGVPSF